MNYATKVGKPTAHITNKKSRLKVYNGHNVFLNDGDNFEFEIHNPTSKTVLAKIKLNGEYISSSGIIIRPGQRVFLERFLDTNNKFEFSTYKVKNTSENRTAITLNGDVLVEFYDEKTYTPYPHLVGGNWNSGWTTINCTGTSNHWNGNTTYTTNGVGFATTSNAFYNSTSDNFSNPTSINKSKIETGRVEKGETSNQNFSTSYEQFEYFVSHSIKLKILPTSTKNIEVKEIRHYCTECGTKMKKNYKFCPSCGNKV